MVKNLKEDYKKIAFAFFATMMVHFIKFVNHFPTWDSTDRGFNMPWSGMTNHGRWFSGILKRILASAYDLPWVEGVVSALFIALTIVIIIRLLGIENKIYQFIAIAAFVTFPAITSTFAYMFWSPAYMCALFMGVFSVYLCINFKPAVAIPVGAVLLTLSLATYQLYVPFSLMVFVFFIATRLLNAENKFRDYKLPIISLAVSLVIAAAIYVVVGKFAPDFFGVEVSEYQGVDTIGIMSISQYIIAVKTSIAAFVNFFIGEAGITFYGIVNVIIAVAAVALAIRFVIFKKDIKFIRRILILVLFLLSIPLTYCFYFASEGVFYHTLMELGNYSVYLFVVIILDRNHEQIKPIFKRAVAGVLVVLCFYNFVNANVAYQQMHMSYERTYFEMSEIMMQVDELKSEDVNTVAIIGSFEKSNNLVKPVPSIMGASTDNMLWIPVCVQKFSQHYLGRTLTLCSNDEYKAIKNSAEYEQMPVYPSKGSVAVIEGVIVIKLSNESK